MTNPINIEADHTLYSIKTIMNEDTPDITIGKLGTFTFQKGIYVYVGSAKRNIQSRIERHIIIEKKQRWHFDYLRPFVEIVEIETYSGDEGECRLFHRLMKENKASIPVRGFGSSDCKCRAHLFYFHN
ncbi:nuclease [Anaerobacillus arseniciselenatis]|uniref:Nuclease n=1 Tax=Anaerobacillus arseniciselenatis TaxID=85682 RepID=A0A1S2LV40_9BACI|nr:GIY-YIG nuclease family protein [Anaerobacillus arseniciselenatis]OIJ15517.1 nuclease [Anaerobacillus arseniciselenatis]